MAPTDTAAERRESLSPSYGSEIYDNGNFAEYALSRRFFGLRGSSDTASTISTHSRNAAPPPKRHCRRSIMENRRGRNRQIERAIFHRWRNVHHATMLAGVSRKRLRRMQPFLKRLRGILAYRKFTSRRSSFPY